MFRTVLFAVFLLASIAAQAGGRGGHVTTFDPNLFGGPANVSCLTALIPGTCATGYNAACNGIANDSPALTAWRTAAIAANPTRAILYIPPGSKCHFAGQNGPLWDGTLGGLGVQNLTVWAYGATADTFSFQVEGFIQNNTHSALINSANIGDTTVTVNDGNVGRFAVGNWICVTGLSLATSGYPPNFQFFEYKLITAINGSIISLNSPLVNAYKSTWPVVIAGNGGINGPNGPATIQLMAPSWNINATLLGLTVPGPASVNSSGRDVMHYDVVFTGINPAPSTGNNIWYFGGFLGPQVEVDKEITSLNFIKSTAQQILVQSASVNTMLLDGVILTGALNGLPLNTTIRNSVLNPVAFIGPTQFGHGNSITVDGTVIPVSGQGFTTGPAIIRVDPTTLSYSSGIFSIPVASAGSIWQWAVPGQKYFFADASNHQCSTPTTFRITDLNVVSATLNIVTDLVGALPTPCGGGPATWYVAYPAATIMQKFSGPADLTQFAAPP